MRNISGLSLRLLCLNISHLGQMGINRFFFLFYLFSFCKLHKTKHWIIFTTHFLKTEMSFLFKCKLSGLFVI